MFYSSLLFWLLLGIPGYAALRRFDHDQLKSGLLGVICLSYLGTLVLLTPVMVVGYLLRLPLAVFSGACVVLVVAGLVDLSRTRAWRDTARLASAALGVELLLVVGDMWLSARTGSIMAADATVHLGHIRFLLDHGLSNADPYVTGDYFFHLYHTNLLHTLCAAASQLAGVSHFGVWFAALPWAKLLAASGVYYLAWSVWGRRWPAWVAVAFIVGMQGPVTFMIYPNKLAPFWLLACVLGLVVQVCYAPRWRTVAWVAGALLVSGQVHALYGGFALMLCGPAVALAVVRYGWRRRPGVGTLVSCGLALTLFLPFALIARPHRAAPAEKDAVVGEAVDDVAGDEPTAAGPELDAHRFVSLGRAGCIKDPLEGFGSGQGVRYWWLLGGAICGLASRRRWQVLTLFTMLLTASAVFYIPPLCAAAIRVLGAKWILLRLDLVFFLAFAVLVAGYLAYFASHWNPPQRVRAAGSLLAFLIAIPFTQHRWPYNWDAYTARALRPHAQRLESVSGLVEFRRFLAGRLPPGATVLVEPSLGTLLVAAHDCHLIAPERGSIGVPHAAARREDARAALWGASEERREELLQRYDIEYVFVRDLPNWASARATKLGSSKYGDLWKLGPPALPGLEVQPAPSGLPPPIPSGPGAPER